VVHRDTGEGTHLLSPYQPAGILSAAITDTQEPTEEPTEDSELQEPHETHGVVPSFKENPFGLVEWSICLASLRP
jgi:hypothetical protein